MQSFHPVLRRHDLDRLVVVLHASRGVAVVGDAITVLAEQFHAVGKLAQRGGDLAILHASSRALAKMASNIATVNLPVNVFC